MTGCNLISERPDKIGILVVQFDITHVQNHSHAGSVALKVSPDPFFNWNPSKFRRILYSIKEHFHKYYSMCSAVIFKVAIIKQVFRPFPIDISKLCPHYYFNEIGLRFRCWKVWKHGRFAILLTFRLHRYHFRQIRIVKSMVWEQHFEKLQENSFKM